MINSTTGAPNTAVTVLILSSVGANIILASKSQNRQNTAPPRKQAGIIYMGFVLFSMLFTMCGTAIPTNDIGPANATIHAESRLESNTRSTRIRFMFTPRFTAYDSPS